MNYWDYFGYCGNENVKEKEELMPGNSNTQTIPAKKSRESVENHDSRKEAEVNLLIDEIDLLRNLNCTNFETNMYAIAAQVTKKVKILYLIT